MRMFVLVLVPKTTAQRVPLGDAGGSPIADPCTVTTDGAAGATTCAVGRSLTGGVVRSHATAVALP